METRKYSYKKMTVVGRTRTGKRKNIKIETLEKQRLLTFWIVNVYNAFFKQGIVNSPCSLAWLSSFSSPSSINSYEKEKNHQN
jgi:hypothetical protein